MKKIYCFFLLLCCLDATAQEKDWFFSLSSSYVINGPGLMLREKMDEQHFNSYSVGWIWDQEYPIKGWRPNLLVRGGMQVRPKIMAFALAGLADNGWVKGYRESADYSQSTIETHPRVDYKLLQFGAGIMYSPGKLMVGIAPGIYILNYQFYQEDPKSAKAMGVNFSLQVPIRKPGNKLGLDLLIETNYSSSMEMSRWNEDNDLFQPGEIKIFSGSVGLAFSFRPSK